MMAKTNNANQKIPIVYFGFKDMKNYRQLISYARLSPREYSSGSSIKAKARICKQSGKTLRNILYMCSISAIKSNHTCKQLYERLVAKGRIKNWV